jgi:hypothetical protein
MPTEVNLNQQADELMELMKDELVIEGNQQQQQQEPPKEEEQQQEQQQELPKNEEPPKQEIDLDDDSEKMISEFFKIIGVEEEVKLDDFNINTLAEKTKEIIEKVKEEVAELKADDDIVKLAEWKKNGGTLNSFMAIPQRIEYSKFELSEEDETAQVEAIISYLSAKGEDEQEINDRIEFWKDKGKLFENAQKALNNLDKLNEKEVNDYREKEQERINNQIAIIENTWKEVETIVKSGVINDYKLPESEKASFNKYVLRDDKGVSQADIKRGQLTTQQMLLIDYLIMKDFKVVGLDKMKIEKKAEPRTIGNMFKGKSSNSGNKELSLDDIL